MGNKSLNGAGLTEEFNRGSALCIVVLEVSQEDPEPRSERNTGTLTLTLTNTRSPASTRT